MRTIVAEIVWPRTCCSPELDEEPASVSIDASSSSVDVVLAGAVAGFAGAEGVVGVTIAAVGEEETDEAALTSSVR